MPHQSLIVNDRMGHRLHQIIDLAIGQDVAIDQLGQVTQILAQGRTNLTFGIAQQEDRKHIEIGIGEEQAQSIPMLGGIDDIVFAGGFRDGFEQRQIIAIEALHVLVVLDIELIDFVSATGFS